MYENSSSTSIIPPENSMGRSVLNFSFPPNTTSNESLDGEKLLCTLHSIASLLSSFHTLEQSFSEIDLSKPYNYRITLSDVTLEFRI